MENEDQFTQFLINLIEEHHGSDLAEAEFKRILADDTELRDQYRGIQGAFHWNKKYWNEVHFDTDVPDDLILQLIDHSLSEVLRKLPKKTQAEYAALQA